MDLDFILLSEKPTVLTSTTNDDDIFFYKAWEISNRLSPNVYANDCSKQYQVHNYNTENVKDFIKFMKNMMRKHIVLTHLLNS